MDFSKYFEKGWYTELKDYVESPEFFKIAKQISQERKKYIIFPKKDSDLLFKVFKVTPYNSLKVVILGQDIYYAKEEQYDGLAFSNSRLFAPQPTLSNILEEVENDVYDGLNINRLTDYSLYNWAEQGVLLINTAHTVRKGMPGSHLHYWKNFTKKVIEALNKKDNLIFLLWGRHAQSFKDQITNKTHKIIETSHPSPLSVFKEAPIPFSDSKCFSKCNKYLKEFGLKEIKW